jgi:hypothetical protein
MLPTSNCEPLDRGETESPKGDSSTVAVQAAGSRGGRSGFFAARSVSSLDPAGMGFGAIMFFLNVANHIDRKAPQQLLRTALLG